MRPCDPCTNADGCVADNECWQQWWDSLTPEEQAAETASMNSYEPDREEVGGTA